MQQSRSVTLDLIGELQQVPGDTLVSVYMPAVVAGPETRQNRIRFKNQLKSLEEAIDEDQRRALGDNWDALAACENDHDLWQHTGQGMAWFVSRDRFVQVSLPVEPEEHASVADHFFVRPLFLALEANQPFQLLTLSVNQVNLYRGDGYELQQEALRDAVPKSLAEAFGTTEEDTNVQDEDASDQFHSPQAGPAGGQGARSAIYHDQNEGEHTKERIREYLSRVSRALEDTHALDDDIPLVLGGAGFVTTIMNEVGGLRPAIVGNVDGNLDDANLTELHSRAWFVVQSWLQEQRHKALGDLAELSPEKVERTLEGVVSAAMQGRVETAFYVPGVGIDGVVDQESLRAQRTAEDEDEADDLVDRALQETLLHGGRVFAVTEAELSQSAEQPVAAVMRY